MRAYGAAAITDVIVTIKELYNQDMRLATSPL